MDIIQAANDAARHMSKSELADYAKKVRFMVEYINQKLGRSGKPANADSLIRAVDEKMSKLPKAKCVQMAKQLERALDHINQRLGGADKPSAKGFVQINAARHEQEELRALASEFGVDLRTFLRHAVLEYQMKHRELLATARQIGIRPATLLQWTCNPDALVKN